MNFVERVAVHATPVIAVSDLNVHLDDHSASLTTSFHDILSGTDLIQFINGVTHRTRHMLDVVIARNDMVVSVVVDPPIISDQSLISHRIKVRFWSQRRVSDNDDCL